MISLSESTVSLIAASTTTGRSKHEAGRLVIW